MFEEGGALDSNGTALRLSLAAELVNSAWELEAGMGADGSDETAGYKDDVSSVLETIEGDTESADVSVGFKNAVGEPDELSETLENGVSIDCSVEVPKPVEGCDGPIKSVEDSDEGFVGELDHVE